MKRRVDGVATDLWILGVTLFAIQRREALGTAWRIGPDHRTYAPVPSDQFLTRDTAPGDSITVYRSLVQPSRDADPAFFPGTRIRSESLSNISNMSEVA